MGRPTAETTVFTAIADPTRRAILDLLRDGERSVASLRAAADAMVGPSTPSGFSQHLAVLRRAGLVTQRKAGRRRVYSVEPAPLREVSVWIGHFDRFWSDKLVRLGQYLDRRNEDQPETAPGASGPDQETP
jgi:DNA-binding transcriptional ArsR family regulator